SQGSSESTSNNTPHADEAPTLKTETQREGIKKLCKELGKESPRNLEQMTYQATRELAERLVGEKRARMNARNGHAPASQPTSTENAPSPEQIRRRCAQLHVNPEQLATKILKANIPQDNWTPENCAQLK